MAEKMTTEERLNYLDGYMATLNTAVLPTIINKMSLETRQTLALFFSAIDERVNPSAPVAFRQGAIECLNNLAKLIETTENH